MRPIDADALKEKINTTFWSEIGAIIDNAPTVALNALPSAEAADVYKAHEEEHLNIVNRIKELQYAIAKTQTIVGKMVKSSEAEPTVIRSRTLMRKEEFKEWAKRIREVNPNAVIIPCDAEVVSVETEWIPCSERLPSEERYYLCCNKGYLPFIAHYYGGQWHDFYGIISHVEAWQPLPKPYREDGEA